VKTEVIILKAAEHQLLNHFTWLENQGSDLGLAFHHACEEAFALLVAHPEIAPRYAGRFRRYVLRKWQVGLFYSNEGGRILVHGALHLRQSPDSIRKALGL
jgi:plasmid stabilization system protein ParE